jgi:hypothetical protein
MLDRLPDALLGQVALALEDAANARGLALACRATASAWRGVRGPWAGRCRAAAARRAALRAAVARDNGAAAAELLAAGGPGAEAAAAEALAAAVRVGAPRAARALSAWAVQHAPALLAPRGGASGPLVLAAAAGRAELARCLRAALLQAARPPRGTRPPLPGDVQAQLDRGLSAASAGGHLAVMADLLAAGARCGGNADADAGAGAAGPGSGGPTPLLAAVANRQAAAAALLLERPAPACSPPAWQAAAAAVTAAGCGFTCCLRVLLAARGGAGLGGEALGAALLAAARGNQAACVAVLLDHARAAGLLHASAPEAPDTQPPRDAARDARAAASGPAACKGAAGAVAAAAGAAAATPLATLREALAAAPPGGKVAPLLRAALEDAGSTGSPPCCGARPAPARAQLVFS